MKKMVFAGQINGIKFDDYDSYLKYYQEHRDDVQSMTYNIQLADVDNQKQADSKNEPGNGSSSLYPNLPDPDEFITKCQKENTDITAALEETAQRLKKQSETHRNNIRKLGVDVLNDHRHNLYELWKRYKSELSKSREAYDKLNSEASDLEHKLDSLKKKMEVVSAGENLLRLYEDHLKLLTIQTEKLYDDLTHNETTQQKRSASPGIQRLLNEIFG